MINMQPQPYIRSVSSQQLIKDQNTMLLFNLVRKKAPISRAELARVSGLSPATVSMLIEELISNQWVRETDAVPATTERGRKPIFLEVNESRGFVATIEILSHGYICSLYDICLHKVASIRSRDVNSTTQQVSRTLLTLVRSKRIAQSRLLGVHVIFPGLFDAATGALGFSAVIPESDMIARDLVAALRQQLSQTHVMISNDATVIAYSAFMANESADCTPLLAMTVYEGINAGVVMGGGGEMSLCLPIEAGHIVIARGGPLCKCGNRGCLETLCATPALFRAMVEQTDLTLEYRDTYGAECNQTAMATVAEAFCKDDAAVCAVLADYADALCCGLISIVNLFAVRSIHIGGAIRVLGEPFAQLLRKTLHEKFHTVTNTSELALSLFDDDYEDSRKAAVMLTMERIFKNAQ